MKKKLALSILMMTIIVNGVWSQGRRPGDDQPIVPFENMDAVTKGLDELSQTNKFSGVALIVKNGGTAFHQAYGFASKEDRLKNQLDTRFNIGSCNKIFTQVAVMRLIQRGEVKMEDQIIKYIPELKMDMADKITIRHLLTMSSGLGFYSDVPAYANNWRDFKDMEDYVPVLTELSLSFEPGSSTAYSNAGYELLGILVQRVSKLSYYDYMKKHIYAKAGMQNTDAYESDKATKNLAQGYTNYAEGEMMRPGSKASGSGFTSNNINRHSIKGTAAGGGYSTAQDMWLFVNALWNNKLLDEKHTDLIFNTFGESKVRKPTLGFGGGSLGINAMVLSDFEKGRVVIVMANYDPPTASNMAQKLWRSLIDGKI